MYECALILAGGKSSRMGKDKALLPFGGALTMTHYLHKKLEPLFSHIYVSAKEDKFDGAFALLYDRYEETSPLVAIVSALESLPYERIFIVSVDTPGIDRDIVDRLYKAHRNDDDAVIAATGETTHPLCAVYTPRLLPAAKAALQKGDHTLHRLLQTCRIRTVAFDPDDARFANLNRPEEYEAACKRFM